MQRTTPPFRADHVGSILRTAPLKDARAKHAKREITDAQLAEVENREIDKIIRKQEEVGLKVATDGEFRRSWWQFDFYKGLDGVGLYSTGGGIQFAGEMPATSAGMTAVLVAIVFPTAPGRASADRGGRDRARSRRSRRKPCRQHGATAPGWNAPRARRR